MPYKPENDVEESATAIRFRSKNDEWHPNPDDEATHTDEARETLTPHGNVPRLQHFEGLRAERKLYGERGRLLRIVRCSR